MLVSAKSTNTLTIYESSSHIIQKFGYISSQTHGTRSGRDSITDANRSESVTRRVLIPLPHSVKSSSLVILDTTGRVIPFKYHPQLTTPSNIVTVIKGSNTTTGDLIELSDHSVTILSDQRLTVIKDYDLIRTSMLTPCPTPYLSIELPRTPFTLSYLLDNITWKCIGTAIINHGYMTFRLAGQISNHTNRTFEGVTVLVSGHLNTTEEHHPKLMRAAAPLSSSSVGSDMVEDFTRYDVGERIIHTKDIVELGIMEIGIQRLYVYITSSDIVSVGYRCDPQRYLPACDINMYTADADGLIDAFIGTTKIEESRYHNSLDLIFGQSKMIECQTIIEQSDTDQFDIASYNLSKLSGQKWHLITEDVTVTVRNFNVDTSILLIKHPISTNKIINIDGPPVMNQSPQYLEWIFQVPPSADSPIQFKCVITSVAHYNI